MFLDAGIQPVHENCMNYGGMGWPYTLELLENVPGLKLVFDTANPVFNEDRSKVQPWPKQDPWEFYEHVKEHVVHVHVKDARWNNAKNDADYTMPGDGDGKVRQILTDLIGSGYSSFMPDTSWEDCLSVPNTRVPTSAFLASWGKRVIVLASRKTGGGHATDHQQGTMVGQTARARPG